MSGRGKSDIVSLVWRLLTLIVLIAIYDWYARCRGLPELSLVDVSSGQAVHLPYSYEDGPKELRLAGTVRFRAPRGRLDIVTKDCLLDVNVDGVTAFRSSEPCTIQDRANPVRLGGVGNGVKVNAYDIALTVRSLTKFGYFDVLGARSGSVLHLIEVILGILGILWLLFTRSRNMAYVEFVVPLTALVLGLAYYDVTSPWTRQNDEGGHREYIKYVLDKHSVPPVKSGWETYQPPLYYLGAAFWGVVGSYVSKLDFYRIIQTLSLLAYVVAVIAACIEARTLPMSPLARAASLTIFAFLPIHVYQAGVINNDALVAFWGAVVFLLSWRYTTIGSPVFLVLLGIGLSFAVMTKLSAMPLVAGAACTVLAADLASGAFRLKSVRNLLLVVGPPAALVAVWAIRNHAQTGEAFYVNSDLPLELRCENSSSRFLSFSPQILWRSADMYSDGVKTSLPTAVYVALFGGDYPFEKRLHRSLALIRACFVPFALLGICGIVRFLSAKRTPFDLAVGLFSFYNVLFLVAYNAQYPYTCNHNARVLAPGLLAFALLIGRGIDLCSGIGNAGLQWVLRVLFALLIACLSVFYLSLVAL